LGKHSTTARIYLRFIAWTFLAVAATAVIVTVIRVEAIRSQTEEAAAATVSRAIGPVLVQEAGRLSEADLAGFTDVARGLLSDEVRAIRLWNPAGELLATTATGASPADAEALARASAGQGSAFKEGDLLVSYASQGSLGVLEIRQDYAPVAQDIARSRQTFVLLMVASSVTLLAVLPVVLWAATRGLKGEYDRLLYLYRTGQTVRSSLDLTEVMEQMARDGALFTHAQAGLASLLEEESNDLILKGSFESEGDSTAQHHRKIEAWFLRRCAATSETVHAQLDTFPYGSLTGYERSEDAPVTVLSVPIPGRDRAIGVVTVVRAQGRGPFTATEVSMVEEMAAQGAMAVEQALLFAKVRGHASEVELSYDATLKVLMAALDTKDAASHGHSERVSRLTVAVARELKVPKERLVDIERGALLHDVGKIGVPDEVLQKDAPLSEGEWEAMRKHPLLAGLMVSKVGFLEGAMPILMYHHERFDGSGYPFGLKGEAIPLEARIFAAVDAYDAMTSDRPYRKAMPPEEALRDIQRNAGTQFDPRVAEAFTRVIARMQPLRQRRRAA
jgi:HD-GYP domain-containing protein (c-di-GMP phosphodiesterase class II)